MKISILSSIAICLSATGVVLGQQQCTASLIRDPDCQDVIGANNCYNQFRFDSRSLSCVSGVNNADRARKLCKCCRCVGQQLCDAGTRFGWCRF